MTDPVADRNNDDERQALELAMIDRQLDDEQARIDGHRARDPLKAYWFGIPD